MMEENFKHESLMIDPKISKTRKKRKIYVTYKGVKYYEEQDPAVYITMK